MIAETDIALRERHADTLKITARLKAKSQAETLRLQAELHGDENVNRLLELVEKYEAKWPGICYAKGGSRARKAMEYVLRGQVRLLYTDRHGHDIWQVSSHQCSKRGLSCDCEDRIAAEPTYGKLCCHRLAVALKTNWQGDQNSTLLDLLRRFKDQSHVDLLIERDYEWHGDGQRAVIVGYQPAGEHEFTRLDRVVCVETTLPQFQWALQEVGLGLAELPEKLPGWSNYCYRLQPGEGIPVNEETFYHKGRTWVMEDRERSRQMILGDIAANLNEWINGRFPVKLSDYETKRVRQLRQEMIAQEKQAAEVWALLPASLQAAILENQEDRNAN